MSGVKRGGLVKDMSRGVEGLIGGRIGVRQG